jgi:hypothetical protein
LIIVREIAGLSDYVEVKMEEGLCMTAEHRAPKNWARTRKTMRPNRAEIILEANEFR